MEARQITLNRLTVDMQLRGMSENTREAYGRHVGKFLEFSGKAADDVNEDDVRAYLIHLMREGRLSAVSINLRNSAIRFFFAVTLNKTLNYLQLPRFKKQRTLPEIPSREEIQKLIHDCCPNIKHKAFLLLAYGGGMRVSEIAGLRVKDIDSKSMRVFVLGGKGGKDRYTILSKECLRVLRDYWSVYRPKHPEGWLFLGSKNTKILPDSISAAFKSCLKSSGIAKNVSIHSLRHAFATHLLEDGATIFQIKELLGHGSLSSTTIYLHLANTMDGVVSPADRYVSHA